MKRSIFYSIVLSATVFLLSASTLFAGGIDRFIFEPSGLRADPSSTSKDLVFVEARVKSLCADGSLNVCVLWNLVLSDSSLETAYAGKIQEALAVWSNAQDVPVKMDYAGVISANPEATSVDSFGNPLMQGNFLISFSPPSNVLFSSSEASKTIHYVVPDLANKAGEIKWAGIYFNPAKREGIDYDLKSALLHEIGRSLGLSPSGVTNSVMYPIRSTRSALHSDDLMWVRALYATATSLQKYGKISGEAINGQDGSPWIGAHIEALPVSKIESVAATLDRTLFTAGTFSKDGGKFTFPALPVGQYILFAEPNTNMPASFSFLDHWLKKFSTGGDPFEMEYYDGAERESNQEPAYAFSAPIIRYAATLTVTANEDNSGVSIITNVADPNIELISAKGALKESLSSQTAPAQKEASESDAAAPAESSDLGGCKLEGTGSTAWMSSLLGIFSVLFLLLQVRQGLKAKLYRSEFQKRERYYR